MEDLPEHVTVADATFSLIDADDSLACWALESDATLPAPRVLLVIEPASAPPADVLVLAGTVVQRFDEYVLEAIAYLREHLANPRFALSAGELARLHREPAPFAQPEAVVWGDGTWMLRFAEAGLEMADPFGIGVQFDGTAPSGVEDLSDAEAV